MITTPTVLILGAGASCPYGFPTAKGLKELICEEFSSTGTRASQFLSCLNPEGSKYAPEEFSKFRDAFLKSGQPSVDAFLQRRPEFLGVGKLAIAFCLMPFEKEETLYHPDSNDWYEYLSVKLNSSFEEFGKNKLSIITFNYDRSLEHYLLNSLMNLHGKPRDECVKALAQIPIVHVYGQIGERPYPQQGSQMYRPDQIEHPRYVETAAAGIRLYHEEAEAASTSARELLSRAKRICFLGFSYNPLNVARLSIGGSLDLSTMIIGTTRGLFGIEIEEAKNRLADALGGDIHLRQQVNFQDNLDILREHMFLG
jgi:NAD-dependent SIR2 family protein deacetylase